MKKNCKDCIKNNRKPNAIGCLECSVYKNNLNNIAEKNLKNPKKSLDIKN